MNNPDTELIFPLRVIPCLADSRDGDWKDLVDFISSENASLLDKLGFVLTMVRMAGCGSCNSDSFRAMRGCTQCALQAVRRQHMDGGSLKKIFEQNRKEVENFFGQQAISESPI